MIFFRHICQRYDISTGYPGRGVGASGLGIETGKDLDLKP